MQVSQIDDVSVSPPTVITVTFSAVVIFTISRYVLWLVEFIDTNNFDKLLNTTAIWITNQDYFSLSKKNKYAFNYQLMINITNNDHVYQLLLFGAIHLLI